MKYQIAIDPGLSATGWAVFCEGKVVEIGTIRPKGPDRMAKLSYLFSQMVELFYNYWKIYGAFPAEITVEQWESHSPVERFQTMVVCAEARGIIVGVSLDYCSNIKYLSKGTSSKKEAAFLANAVGLVGSEHARDAFHLGCLAGYYK